MKKTKGMAYAELQMAVAKRAICYGSRACVVG